MMSFNLPFFGIMSLAYLLLGALWMVAYIGRAVQAQPMKPRLKTPLTKRLKP
jgi:hypothetical protein